METSATPGKFRFRSFARLGPLPPRPVPCVSGFEYDTHSLNWFGSDRKTAPALKRTHNPSSKCTFCERCESRAVLRIYSSTQFGTAMRKISLSSIATHLCADPFSETSDWALTFANSGPLKESFIGDGTPERTDPSCLGSDAGVAWRQRKKI